MKCKAKKPLIIQIDKTGIGEERIQSPELVIEETVLDIVKNELSPSFPEPSRVVAEPTKNKNEIIFKYLVKLFNKIIRKKHPGLVTRLNQKITQVWRMETTNDLLDLIKFVLIHGILGLAIFTAILTVTNVDIVLIQLIKNSWILTAMCYMIGSGSGYYILLDCNKAIHDIWSKRQNKK